MRAYAGAKVLQKSQKDLSIKSKLNRAVRDSLVQKAEGVILCFKIVLDQWLDRRDQPCSEAELENFVPDVPSDLNGIYEQALERILPIHRPKAAVMLLLVNSLWLSREYGGEEVAHFHNLYGAYDFLAELSSGATMQGFESRDHFQASVTLLLSGWSTSWESSQDGYIFSPTDLSACYIHKTLGAYLARTDWTEETAARLLCEDCSKTRTVSGRISVPYYLKKRPSTK